MTAGANLKAPFAYQGGKSRLARQIVDKLWAGTEACYVDVCCGAGSVSLELANRGATNIIMIDSGPMGAFWQMVSRGEFSIQSFKEAIEAVPADKAEIKPFMERLSKVEYSYVGEVIYEYLLLQAAAFGSKQIFDEGTKFGNCSFRSYWLPTATSSRRSPVNPMMPMPEGLFNNVKAIVEGMRFVKALHTQAENFNFNCLEGEVVTYIDPPYAGTTGYGDMLDLDNLIQRARKVGNVFVSEYQLKGADVEFTLSKTNKGGITGNTHVDRVEKLFLLNKEVAL